MPPLSQLSSCTPLKATVYVTNSLAAAVSDPDFFWILIVHVPNLKPLFH